jgi:hypothetical protein
MSLTDIQIKDLAKKMNVPLGGVYFKDEIPKVQFNKSYFINMEDCEDEKGQLNPGTHWVFLQVNKYPNDEIKPIYFDAYGQPPPENVKKAVAKITTKYLPYTKKDIQSLMNNACGFYCLALAHFINSSKFRCGHLYDDVADFLDFFDDLNTEVDFKKNEFILKQFFRSSEEILRTPIDVIKPISSISSESEKGGIDMMKIPVSIKQL